MESSGQSAAQNRPSAAFGEIRPQFVAAGAAIRAIQPPHIARLDPSSGAADLFDPTPNQRPVGIAQQANGKILVLGNFTTIGGQSRGRIARLDGTTGTADSFAINLSESLLDSIALQADGKVLLTGKFR